MCAKFSYLLYSVKFTLYLGWRKTFHRYTWEYCYTSYTFSIYQCWPSTSSSWNFDALCLSLAPVNYSIIWTFCLVHWQDNLTPVIAINSARHTPAGSDIQTIRSDHLVCGEVVVNVLVTESGDGQSVVYVAHQAAVREMKEKLKQSAAHNMTLIFLHWLFILTLYLQLCH